MRERTALLIIGALLALLAWAMFLISQGRSVGSVAYPLLPKRAQFSTPPATGEKETSIVYLRSESGRRGCSFASAAANAPYAAGRSSHERSGLKAGGAVRPAQLPCESNTARGSAAHAAGRQSISAS